MANAGPFLMSVIKCSPILCDDFSQQDPVNFCCFLVACREWDVGAGDRDPEA